LFEIFDQYFKVKVVGHTFQVELPPIDVSLGVYEWALVRTYTQEKMLTGKAEVVKRKMKFENKLPTAPDIELKIPKTPKQQVKEILKTESIMSSPGVAVGRASRIGDYIKGKKKVSKRKNVRLRENSFDKVFNFLLKIGDTIPPKIIDDWELEQWDDMIDEIESITNLLTTDTLDLSEGVLLDGFLFQKKSDSPSRKRSKAWYQKNKHKVKANKKKIENERLNRMRKKFKNKPITPQMKRKRKNHTRKHTNEMNALRRVLVK
jgi:hypothetical protein